MGCSMSQVSLQGEKVQLADACMLTEGPKQCIDEQKYVLNISDSGEVSTPDQLLDDAAASEQSRVDRHEELSERPCEEDGQDRHQESGEWPYEENGQESTQDSGEEQQEEDGEVPYKEGEYEERYEEEEFEDQYEEEDYEEENKKASIFNPPYYVCIGKYVFLPPPEGRAARLLWKVDNFRKGCCWRIDDFIRDCKWENLYWTLKRRCGYREEILQEWNPDAWGPQTDEARAYLADLDRPRVMAVHDNNHAAYPRNTWELPLSGSKSNADDIDRQLDFLYCFSGMGDKHQYVVERSPWWGPGRVKVAFYRFVVSTLEDGFQSYLQRTKPLFCEVMSLRSGSTMEPEYWLSMIQHSDPEAFMDMRDASDLRNVIEHGALCRWIWIYSCANVLLRLGETEKGLAIQKVVRALFDQYHVDGDREERENTCWANQQLEAQLVFTLDVKNFRSSADVLRWVHGHLETFYNKVRLQTDLRWFCQPGAEEQVKSGWWQYDAVSQWDWANLLAYIAMNNDPNFTWDEWNRNNKNYYPGYMRGLRNSVAHRDGVTFWMDSEHVQSHLEDLQRTIKEPLDFLRACGETALADKIEEVATAAFSEEAKLSLATIEAVKSWTELRTREDIRELRANIEEMIESVATKKLHSPHSYRYSTCMMGNYDRLEFRMKEIQKFLGPDPDEAVTEAVAEAVAEEAEQTSEMVPRKRGFKRPFKAGFSLFRRRKSEPVKEAVKQLEPTEVEPGKTTMEQRETVEGLQKTVEELDQEVLDETVSELEMPAVDSGEEEPLPAVDGCEQPDTVRVPRRRRLKKVLKSVFPKLRWRAKDTKK